MFEDFGNPEDNDETGYGIRQWQPLSLFQVTNGNRSDDSITGPPESRNFRISDMRGCKRLLAWLMVLPPGSLALLM